MSRQADLAELPIPPSPGQDPLLLIEQIAKDMLATGNSVDRRAGRRILGALEQYWADAGADTSD